MRLLILSIISLCLISSCKQNSDSASFPDTFTEMPWVKLDDVEALVEKEPRKVIVDVYTPWCGPCKMMDQRTFKDPEVIQKLGKEYYPVKFNAEGPDPVTFKGKEYSNPNYNPARAKTRNAKHQLTPFFSVRGYPSLVILNEEMEIQDKIVGFKTAEQLLSKL